MEKIKYVNELIINIGILEQYREVNKHFVEEIILFQCGKDYLCYDEKAKILKNLGVGKYIKEDKNSPCVSIIHFLTAIESVTKILACGYRVVVVKQLKFEKRTVRQICGVIEKIEEINSCDLTNVYIKGIERNRQLPETLIYNKETNIEKDKYTEIEDCITNYDFCKGLLEDYIIFVYLNNKYYSFRNDAIFISVLTGINLLNSLLELEEKEFEEKLMPILNCGKKVALVSYDVIVEESKLFHRKIDFIDTMHDIPFVFPNKQIESPQKCEENEFEFTEEILDLVNDSDYDVINTPDVEEVTNNHNKYEKMNAVELASNVDSIDLETYFIEHPINNEDLIEVLNFIDSKLLIEASAQNWNIEMLELCIDKVELEVYNDFVGLTISDVNYLSEKYDIKAFVNKHPEFWDVYYIIDNYNNIDVIGYFKKYTLTKSILHKISEYHNVVKLLKAFPNMIDLDFLEKYPLSFNTKELIKSGYLFDLNFLEENNYDINTFLEQAELNNEYLDYIINNDPIRKYKGRLLMNSFCTQDVKASHKDYFFNEVFIPRQKVDKSTLTREEYSKLIHNYENEDSFNKLVEVRKQEEADEKKAILRKTIIKNGY